MVQFNFCCELVCRDLTYIFPIPLFSRKLFTFIHKILRVTFKKINSFISFLLSVPWSLFPLRFFHYCKKNKVCVFNFNFYFCSKSDWCHPRNWIATSSFWWFFTMHCIVHVLFLNTSWGYMYCSFAFRAMICHRCQFLQWQLFNGYWMLSS